MHSTPAHVFAHARISRILRPPEGSGPLPPCHALLGPPSDCHCATHCSGRIMSPCTAADDTPPPTTHVSSADLLDCERSLCGPYPRPIQWTFGDRRTTAYPLSPLTRTPYPPSTAATDYVAAPKHVLPICVVVFRVWPSIRAAIPAISHGTYLAYSRFPTAQIGNAIRADRKTPCCQPRRRSFRNIRTQLAAAGGSACSFRRWGAAGPRPMYSVFARSVQPVPPLTQVGPIMQKPRPCNRSDRGIMRTGIE